MKIKILIVSDNPCLPTGMAVVHRNIGQGLYNLGYDVISLGWGRSNINREIVPWKIYTPQTKEDYYGKEMFDAIIAIERPNIVLTIGDIWTYSYIINSRWRGLFQWIGYVAIDGNAYDGGVPFTWIEILNDMDKIVAYTNYGSGVIGKSLPLERSKIEVIYHGVDLTKHFTFDTAKRLEARKKTGISENTIVYLLVARNQFRKNIPEIFKTWAKFTKDGKHPNAILFPHTVFNDPMGWNLGDVIKTCQIENSIMYLTDFANSGTNLDVIATDQVNILYNISDVVLLLSGEGFGLPLFEAMACSKPIIALNHSACGELVKDRGELVDVLTYLTGAHTTERPLFDKKSLYDKLDLLYNNSELRVKYGKLGNDFVQNYTWEKMSLKWDKLIKETIDAFIDTCKLEVIS